MYMLRGCSTAVLVVAAALAVAMAATAGDLPGAQSVPTQAVHVTRDEYRMLRAFTQSAGQREHTHAGMARLVDAARDVLAAVEVTTQWGSDDDAAWAAHTTRRSVVDSAEVGVEELEGEGIDTPADLQPAAAAAAAPETAVSHAGVDSNGFPLQRALTSAAAHASHGETAEASPLTPDGSHVADTPANPDADKVRARIKSEREQRHMEMMRRRTPRVEEKAELRAPAAEAEVPIEELRAEKDAKAAEAASIEDEPVEPEGATARFPRCKPLKDVDHFALDATDAAAESVSPRAEAAARDEREALEESRAAGLPVAEQKQHTRDEDRHARELRREAFEQTRAQALLGDRTGSLDHAEVGPADDVEEVVGPDGRHGRRVCHIEWESGEAESAEVEGAEVEAESAEAEAEAEGAVAPEVEAEAEGAVAPEVEAEAEGAVAPEAEAEEHHKEHHSHHHKKHSHHHKKHSHHHKKHRVARYEEEDDDEDVVEHRRHSRRHHHRRHKHGSASSHAEYAEEMAPPFSLNDLGLPTGRQQESIPGFNAPLQNMPGVEMPPQQMMMQQPQQLQQQQRPQVQQNTMMLQEASAGAVGGLGGAGGGMAGANAGGIPGMMNMFPGGQNQMGVDLGMASPSRDMGLEMEDTAGVPQQVLPGIGAMP